MNQQPTFLNSIEIVSFGENGNIIYEDQNVITKKVEIEFYNDKKK